MCLPIPYTLSEGIRVDNKQIKSPAKKKGRVIRKQIGLLIFFAITLMGIYWVFSLFRPANGSAKQVEIVIPSGTNAAQIAVLLREKQIIRSPNAFRYYLHWWGEKKPLLAGEYKLAGNMELKQIVKILQSGPNDNRLKITIPEGFTLSQIATRLTEAKIIEGDKFLQIATDRTAIANLKADFPLPKKTLEGYIFPDTYLFEPNTSPEKVVERMLSNFTVRFYRPYQQEIQASKHNLHALVTAASLIEREAKVGSDRARIAGVLENRLARKMLLQIDATVLYALKKHKSRVLYKDLLVNSPYNTYRYRGLPPAPIACPGIAALESALRPEKHNYFYYVARPNGEHIFTRTPAEHEQAKRQARAERQSAENQ